MSNNSSNHSVYQSETSKWIGLVDPGTYMIVACALFVIYHGSYRSYKFNNDNVLQLRDNSHIPPMMYIIMPVVGSISLVALFYFLDVMYYLLLILVSITSLLATSYVFYPLFKYIFSKLRITDHSHKIKLDDEDFDLTFSMLASTILSSILVICWFLSNHYIFVNILSICVGIASLSFMRINNLKGLGILLWCFLLYDVFWVFISPRFFGKSVMENVATQVMEKFYLPMLITFPKFFGYGDGVSGLGNGDFVLPGLFICQLYFIDRHYRFHVNQRWKDPRTYGYHSLALVYYTIGLFFAVFMVILTQRGQPALLYLVPITTIPILVTANQRGHLAILLKPIPKPKQDEEQLEGLVIDKIGISSDDIELTNNINNNDDDDEEIQQI